MKKAIMMLIVIAIAVNSCRIVKQSSKKKETQIAATVTENVKKGVAEKSDNLSAETFNKLFKFNDAFEVSIDKIVHTTDSKDDKETAFVFNVSDLKSNDDTLFIKDKRGGVEGIVYTDKKTGLKEFVIKTKNKQEKHELIGLKISSVKSVDTSISVNKTAFNSSLKVDSTSIKFDSSYYQKEVLNIDKSKSSNVGWVKWIGIIVLVAALLRLAIFLLRNSFPWVGWLNKMLGGK